MTGTTGVMIQYVNRTIECGFMMCDCGKHHGDRCEDGCERQRDMIERTNAHLRSVMENMTKSLEGMARIKRANAPKLPGLTGEPWRKYPHG